MQAGSTDGERVVVVTGAAGRIGAQTCARFAAEGARVIAVDRIAPDGTEAVDQRCVDVTDVPAVRALADDVVADFGRIDVWVNNAGGLQRAKALEIEPDAWRHFVDLNLTATFFGAQAAARHMVASGGGAIINVSSYAGVRPRPNCADYASAKAGVAHLTACLAVEWGEHGIRVNAVAPGYIETPMSAWMHEDREALEWFLSRSPLGRMGQPEEVAKAIAYLSSPEASYVTGEVMLVDGGFAKT